MTTNTLIFDIETVPDVDLARKSLGIDGLEDADVAEAMFARRRQENNGNDFLPHYLHKVVAISMVLRTTDEINVRSLGNSDSSESDIIRQFFAEINSRVPQLVSWNGSGFDLPVLHYRALLHGVNATRYWDTGHRDQNFKWNNYINRFHSRHLDLMDVLAGYSPRANAPLTEIATMLGFPGKVGMDGSKVWDTYLAGHLESIRNYCEMDALNTYLIFLRYRLMSGWYSSTDYDDECNYLRRHLENSGSAHFIEFLKRWV